MAPRASTARPVRKKVKRKQKAAAETRLSPTRIPTGMSLEDWQRTLRQQFGRTQDFEHRNLGEHPVFSEFLVTNPKSNSSYRVAIRGRQTGENFCACADFATNALGTCKHIEFVLGKLEARRGGKAQLEQGYRPPYSEVFLHYGPRREVRYRAGTECPPKLATLAAKYFDAEGRLQVESLSRFEEFLSQATAIDPDLRCYDDVLSFVAERRDAGLRSNRIKQAFPRGIRSAAFKDLLKVSLYDYQREGALFAATAGRCLIGDEMGLGKTIQALAAAEIMARELGVERVLIICPTSLKHQWEQEIERFTQRSCTAIYGGQNVRAEAYRGESFFKITNYDVIHRDLEAIEAWSPDLVILDEAQRIKNWSTRVARSVKKVKSAYAVVLTGTPIENRLQELVSLIEFVDRHRLGPTYQFLHQHQTVDESGRVVGYRDLDRINETLKPILIRRQKKEVLSQLPERLEKQFFVPMTREQLDLHEENRETVARIVMKWRRFGFLSEADQTRLMICLQNMRMSCNSTYLLDHQTDFGCKADELATLLDELFESPDSKAVIFSQWTRMHELVQRRIGQRDWQHVFFHGGVPSQKRKTLVDEFRQNSACRAFLATDAGGVGLNLQHANVVVNLDLPWNPAILEQRIGRVHRMGQTQPVQVVNFVAQGTIEEGMLSVLKFKKDLFAGALDGGAKEVFLGGSRLKKFIESVEQATSQLSPTVASRDETPEILAAASHPTSDQEDGEDREDSEPSTAKSPTAPGATVADPLAGLLQQGLLFLDQVVRSSQNGSGAAGKSSTERTPAGRSTAGPKVQVETDAASGEQFLRIGLPEPDVLNQFLTTIGQLVDQWRR